MNDKKLKKGGIVPPFFISKIFLVVCVNFDCW